MKERTKTAGATRLLWSLLLGLSLALGLLWAMTPHSAAEAQAANPGFAVDLPDDATWSQMVPDDTAPVAHTSADTPAPAPPPSERTPPDFAPPHDRRMPPGSPLGISAGGGPSMPASASARTLAGQSPGLRFPTRALAGDGFAVDLAYDAVWGYVSAGDTITVARTAGGAAYGAAEADGVGFFWTPLWQSNGQPADVVGGDTLAVYINGALDATITPLTITGQVDVLNDQVTGNVSGLAAGTSVTVTLGDFGQMIADVPRVVTTVDGSGDFTADFSGVADIGPHEMAQVQYRDANGNAVQGYVYPSEVFRLSSWSGVRGYATPSTPITVTAYDSGMSEFCSGQTTAQWPHGIYEVSNCNFGSGDWAVVDLGGGTLINVSVGDLEIRPDDAADQVTGKAPSNANVRGYVWDEVDGIYDEDTTTADFFGNYTLNLNVDLETRHTLYVAYADAEGDEVGYFVQPPHILAYPYANGMYAEADGPNQPVTYTLDTGIGPPTVQNHWCGNTNNCDWAGFPSIAPGHIITVQLPNLTMAMTVPSVTLQADTANDTASGDADLPGRLDVFAQQWQSGRYPIQGWTVTSTTVSSPFAVTFFDFDVRDGIYLWVNHYDTNGHLTQIYRGREQAYFEVNPTHNGVGGIPPSADEVVTATLYTAGGVELASTSDDHDGDPWRFWLGDFHGYQFETGHWITVTSESGWEAGLQVPDLTVQVDQDSELIWGEGPKSLLFVEHSGRNGWDGRFVPVDDYALDRAFFGDDIQWGDWINVTYQVPNGNRVRREFQWPHITARYDMEGRNTVFGNNAIPGNTIYITVTDELSQVVDSGTTYAGSGRDGPTSYALDFSDGTLAPSNTVTVNWGDGFVDYVHVVTITANPDVDTDVVTGTAPANGWLNAWVQHQWGDRADINVQVDASGVYTLDFGTEGWDILYGDSFSVYYQAPHGHQVEYSFWVPAPELSINKWNTPGHARPGGVVVYGINYSNNGNGVAEDTLIVDTLPPNTAWAGNTSGIVPTIGAGGVITWNLGNLEAGDSGGFVVTLDLLGGLSDGDTIDQNCVAITTISPGDDPGNNDSCAGQVDVWNDDVDVGVDKWPNPGDPTPGQEFAYHIQPCNRRGAAAGPIWLTDTLPLSTTFVSWSSQFGDTTYWTEVVTTGGQLVLYAPGLPGDTCEYLSLRLLLHPDAPLNTTLENTVVIATAGDVNPDNNERVHTGAHVSPPRYDMRVDKNINWGILAPGGQIGYHVSYNNQGNVATHAWITDTLPPGTSYQPGSGREQDGGPPFPPATITADYVVWDLGVVEVNDGFGFDFTLDISDTVAPGTVLTNCTVVGSTGTEDTPEDNTACVAVTINDHGPNLRVTKWHNWHGDGQLGYQIKFENIGDETVSDVWVTDTLPADTNWDGWWDMDFEWDRLVSDTQSSDVLRWQFSELYPGDSGWLRFNANLDEPGEPMRWYTNTVEIETPSGDVNPDDNIYEDVAFSGGEVNRVELWVNDSYIEISVPQTPVTITTAYTQVVFWWHDFGWNLPNPVQPGDTITVEAGSGIQPVVIPVPDPFTAGADSAADTVFGQISGWNNETVEVHGYWTGGYQEVQTDGSGYYSATYGDVPRGAQGHVRYITEVDYAEVIFHRSFQSLDLIMRVDYSGDWVEGNYEAGHTVWITVTESDGFTVKGTAVLTTGVVPWWGGETGFSTNWQGWATYPDIQPGDWVYGLVNSATYTNTVHVGTINGETDVDADTVSGTIDAPWLAPDLVTVRCEIHEENGPDGIQVYNVDPDGGSFFCDFGGLWDIRPEHNVAVNYTEPDDDRVQTYIYVPTPYLRINKQANGNPGEGGTFAFQIQYWNDGDAPAENTVITDTLLGGMIYITDTSGLPHTGGGSGPIVWNLGTLPASSSGKFYVYVQVTAVESDTITNIAQIATSDPYDQGGPWEKESEWGGHVQANDTHLNVGKWAWTGDPAPDTDFVFSVNVCNNGSTNSSEVTLTDTLHPSMTLQSWWGQHDGWVELFSGTRHLIVSRPTAPAWWCGEVYLRVHLDGSAWPGMYITNTAVITASNDLEGGDNETFWDGWVNDPHTNLNVNKNWNWGQLVPGGEIRYWIDYDNTGNVPVTTIIRITDTLPVSTTFVAAWRYDQYGQHPFTPTQVMADYVVWEISGLDNGYGDNFEIALRVDGDAEPGTLLTNTVEISPQPDEDNYDDNVATVVETLYDHGTNLRVRKSGYWHDWGSDTRRAEYNVTVENVGDAVVMPVVITDTYDSKMYLDGGVGMNYWRWWDWRDDPVSGYFTVTLESLYPGERVDINFSTITDTEPLPFGLIFTNTVEVGPDDPYPDNNSDVVVLTTGPDLYVTKELIAGEPLPGEVITFSLRFGNKREGHEWWWNMQGNAELTDVLPDELEYIGSSEPPDFQAGPNIFWNLWPINAGDHHKIYLTARIADTAGGGDIFTNWVEIESDQPGNDVEPYYDNNEDTYDVSIALPKFEVGKVYESSRVAGMPVTYTLTVTNVGNEAGTNVVLSDTLPVGLTYGGSDGALAGGDVTWAFANIAANGGTVTGWFSGTLPYAGTVTNDDYRVVSSDEGVDSDPGPAVTLDVVAPDLVADFDYAPEPAYILENSTVVFTDTSTTDGPSIEDWLWDFGDGETDDSQNTSHEYTTVGTYTVGLVVTDALGYSDDEIKTNIVVVSPRCTELTSVAFTYAPSSPVIQSAVIFTATYAPLDATQPIIYAWDFGDGGSGSGQVVNHTYALSDTYTVVVTATNCAGVAVVTHSEDVTVVLVEGDQTTVDPATGGTLVYTDTHGNPTTIEVPGGAVSEPVTLLYTPVFSLTQPISPNLCFAGHAFDLDAYEDGTLQSGFVFSKPVTITIHYSDDDVQGISESSLYLYYWTGAVWEDAACGPYDRHPDENWLAVPICHLSRYGILGTSTHNIYLPLVMRNY